MFIKQCIAMVVMAVLQRNSYLKKLPSKSFGTNDIFLPSMRIIQLTAKRETFRAKLVLDDIGDQGEGATDHREDAELGHLDPGRRCQGC